MSDLAKAKKIQGTIRSLLDVSANTLTRIPEMERESAEDAIRKLQVQIFELADAMAEIVTHLELKRSYRPSPRIYP